MGSFDNFFRKLSMRRAEEACDTLIREFHKFRFEALFAEVEVR